MFEEVAENYNVPARQFVAVWKLEQMMSLRKKKNFTKNSAEHRRRKLSL